MDAKIQIKDINLLFSMYKPRLTFTCATLTDSPKSFFNITLNLPSNCVLILSIVNIEISGN
jgi:hypothetical protein